MYSFAEYRDALEGAGPKLKELILDRAAYGMTWDEIIKALGNKREEGAENKDEQ